jgi:thiosulfate dehydrogenase (quinone) large subunit
MSTTLATGGAAVSPAAGTTAAPATIAEKESGAQRWTRYTAALTRLSLGWVFLWAFLDKTFALGFATGKDPATGAVDYFGPAAWINGGSPTKGFLSFGTKGPLADFYSGLAGNPVVDWVFMIGLLGIGLALILGIGMRIAAGTGALMLLMMWSAALWPDNNPFMDDHIVYALVLVLLALLGAGTTWGLGKQWESIPFVQKHGWLK